MEKHNITVIKQIIYGILLEDLFLILHNFHTTQTEMPCGQTLPDSLNLVCLDYQRDPP